MYVLRENLFWCYSLGLMGGSHVSCQFQNISMSPNIMSVVYFSQYFMSDVILHVTIFLSKCCMSLRPMLPCQFKKLSC